MTVLWGGRRGDVQYASRDFWRRNIPIGALTVEVDRPHYFDVGSRVRAAPAYLGDWIVIGLEGGKIGVRLA